VLLKLPLYCLNKKRTICPAITAHHHHHQSTSCSLFLPAPLSALLPLFSSVALPDTLNLLDTRYHTEVNYGLAIDRAQQYHHLPQQEVFNFAAPSLPLSSSSGKDSVSTSEGEKAAAALQDKDKDLQVTLKLLLSVKADGMEEKIQQLESKLAAMKERIT